NTRVQIVGASHRIKDKVLVGLNNRDPRFHDVHLLDLTTGELTEMLRNEVGYAGFDADDNLDIRSAYRQNAEGGMDLFRVVGGKVEAEPFASWGLEDSLTTSTAGYTSDGKTLYWIDSRGRDTAALIAENTETGQRTVIAEDARADIGGTMRDPRTGAVRSE